MPSKETKSNPNIYELSKLQVAVLRQAASGETSTFAVLEPSDELDDTERKERLTNESAEMHALVTLGLAEDISKDFAESITICKRDTKRAYTVLGLTEAGRLMFDYCDDPDCCTNHPKGDSRKRLPC